MAQIRSDQRRVLKDRLQTIRNSKPRTWDDIKLPVPAEVKAAKEAIRKANRIVGRFEKKVTQAKVRRNKAVDAAYNDCSREIHFGDAKSALKALDRFERTKF